MGLFGGSKNVMIIGFQWEKGVKSGNSLEEFGHHRASTLSRYLVEVEWY